MSRLKFFASICVGFAVYSILTLTIGQNGIWAYNQLELQRDALTENVASLQAVNENLILDYQSLISDEARIKALARKLGYVCDGEVLVKINGLTDRGTKVYDCGSVYRTSELLFVEEQVCKMMGIIFFALSFLLFTVTGLRKRKLTPRSSTPAAATVVTIVSR